MNVLLGMKKEQREENEKEFISQSNDLVLSIISLPYLKFLDFKELPAHPKMFIDHDTMIDLVFDARMNRSLWKSYLEGKIEKTDFDYIRYINRQMATSLRSSSMQDTSVIEEI